MTASHGMSTDQLSCPGGRTDRWIDSSSHVTTNQSIVMPASSHPTTHLIFTRRPVALTLR